ncbi:MAG TPA: pyroglutamyl-peptidase I [Candidatus Mcinerneyibacterium sp.]|nr:pyroglutamyl-peptidase I [Candidatus Mcinerneyibacterium sp.]
MKRILLTGFDPFGGEKINPATKVVKKFNKKEINGFKIETLEIPTVYKKSIKKTIKKIEQINPEIVISIGQAGGRFDISIERVAINIDDYRIEDNEGNQPVDKPINPKGENAYFSNLPVKNIVKKIQEKDIPAIVSNSAGTFVCNHVMYGVLDYIYKNNLDIKAGFIHIPYLPSQVVDKKKKPSMSLDTVKRGLELAIKATIENN